MSPVVPEEVTPVRIDKVPVLPRLDEPVLRSMEPVTSDAEPVATETLPLDETPSADFTLTEPDPGVSAPALALAPAPLLMCTLPPSPSRLSPAAIVTVPALPASAEPDPS